MANGEDGRKARGSTAASVVQSGAARKSKRMPGRRKLLVEERVEVRSLEDGFLGSWSPGTVVACTKRSRRVRYDHLLTDDGTSNLVDVVDVSPAIEGRSCARMNRATYRGFIRPTPPSLDIREYNLSFGLCVDVYHEDMWWEGVIFDHENGSQERRVFFPDLGDEMRPTVDLMRITRDWDETTETWHQRGNWLFLDLVENYKKEHYIPVSVRQLWYDVREKKGFQKIKEWTSSERPLWEDLVLEVINDNFKITLGHLFNISGSLQHGTGPLKEASICINDVDTYPEVNAAHTLAEPDKSPWDSVVANINEVRVNLDQERILEHQLPRIYGDISPPMDALIKSCHDEVDLRCSCSKNVPEAESCSFAITEYAVNKKPRKPLIGQIREHLKQLGWKIESMMGLRGAKKLRYISPDGENHYSLLQICKDMVAKSVVPSEEYEVISSTSYQANDDSDPQPCSPASLPPVPELYHAGVPEGNEAVRAYLKMEVINILKRSTWSERMKLNVRIHLWKNGWLFSYRNGQAGPRLRYISPTGKTFHSLREACKAYMKDEDAFWELKGKSLSECRTFRNENSDGTSTNWPFKSSCIKKSVNKDFVRCRGIRKVRESRKLCRKRRNDFCGDSPIGAISLPDIENQKPCVARVKLETRMRTGRVTSMLRSSKTVKQATTSSSSSHHPRTILSWLIDNRVVQPRAKVYYVRREDNFSMSEGRITRNGIKCICCSKVYSISGFQFHVGSKYCEPSASIFLADGRSLLDCQVEAHKRQYKAKLCDESSGEWTHGENDVICSVCHYGGKLILCDRCPSSFHKICLGLKNIPDGDWFCASCCCVICGQNQLKENPDCLRDKGLFSCKQCERRYHVSCLLNNGVDKFEICSKDCWFCSKQCKDIHLGLCELLGKPVLLGPDNLTWTLVKSLNQEDGCEHSSPSIETSTLSCSKLNVALSVMHECFEPVIEPQTRRDLVEDVIFNRESELHRLNFRGFYTILLERDDELITAANVRILGKKVAELPLIGTRRKYRRLGMCRRLMNELEKRLAEFGVERLVLPAVPSVLYAWTASFGFSKMTPSERLQFLGYIFLQFQDTIMCQKLLKQSHAPACNPISGYQTNLCNARFSGEENLCIDGSAPKSEAFQAEQLLANISAGYDPNQDNEPALLTGNQPSRPEQTSWPSKNSRENSFDNSTFREEEATSLGSSSLQCYKRQKLLRSYG